MGLRPEGIAVLTSGFGVRVPDGAPHWIEAHLRVSLITRILPVGFDHGRDRRGAECGRSRRALDPS